MILEMLGRITYMYLSVFKINIFHVIFSIIVLGIYYIMDRFN